MCRIPDYISSVGCPLELMIEPSQGGRPGQDRVMPPMEMLKEEEIEEIIEYLQGL